MKSKGFTLIEIVIVFSIVALVMAVAIPGFSDFNRTQILKTAAEDLKFSFREAQAASLAGKKEECNTSLLVGTDLTCSSEVYCDNSHTLVGHYIALHKGMTNYFIGIHCGITSVVNYPVKNVSFSNGDVISIDRIVDNNGVRYGEINDEEILVIFKPVNKGVGFYKFSGDPSSYRSEFEENIDSLTVDLTNGRNEYSVTITSTGEIYEAKL